jgi:hypothetical protein
VYEGVRAGGEECDNLRCERCDPSGAPPPSFVELAAPEQQRGFAGAGARWPLPLRKDLHRREADVEKIAATVRADVQRNKCGAGRLARQRPTLRVGPWAPPGVTHPSYRACPRSSGMSHDFVRPPARGQSSGVRGRTVSFVRRRGTASDSCPRVSQQVTCRNRARFRILSGTAGGTRDVARVARGFCCASSAARQRRAA